ncbi:MAG: class I tRNA ligase family protein, partial [Chloroflexi bacterium]|nr:class I tRNA ligase family protein [Chloroflexota bacterium]
HAGPVEPGKESPLDFALWKASKPGEPSWDSPWGPGRPGWHIECTAMSIRYLGETLDIHGGGRDLIFPHHENEIAQSESYTGVTPFARYWMHNGMVQVGEEKMSKSLGNLVTVREMLERYTPDAIRLLVLSSHYRNPLTYTEAGLLAAEKGVERLRLAAQRPSPSAPIRIGAPDASAYRQQFIEAMDDDFNTSQAMAALFDLVREINRTVESGAEVTTAQNMLRELTGALGLTLSEPEARIDAERLSRLVSSMVQKLQESGQPVLAMPLARADGGVRDTISDLVEIRRKLRESKQWELADGVRHDLGELGISLEDTPQGTVWRRSGLA